MIDATIKPELRLGVGGVYNKVMSLLPGRVAGRIDFARALPHEGWGGPMNGQRSRQAVVRELYRRIPFRATVETGSFRGQTTQFLAALTEAPVRGVESNSRFHDFARRRCAGYDHVTIDLADSRSFLESWLGTTPGPIFFYLDAHWYLDLPLADEVRQIAASGLPAVVMIDDFEVPDDPGYQFDDYGDGGRLAAPLLADSGISEWTYFYPSTRAADETGLRRGCCVLVSPHLADEVSQISGLRTGPQTRAEVL